MAHKRNNSFGIVYSTDNDFRFDTEMDTNVVVPPREQKLYVKIDKKHRGGKLVTIVEGYRGSDIEDTGKALKKSCGTGGSVKDGLIIIQGDNREKIATWLLKNGYIDVKMG